MTANEFNKIEPTWLDIEKNTKQECINNNVEFYNYTGWFVRYGLFNYRKFKSLIETIEKLDFSDSTKTKAVLNKAHYDSKNEEIKKSIKQFEAVKNKLFEWLDKTNNPYFFILNPVYEYGLGISYRSWVNNNQGYKKVWWTGVQNRHIAIDYANYKLLKN